MKRIPGVSLKRIVQQHTSLQSSNPSQTRGTSDVEQFKLTSSKSDPAFSRIDKPCTFRARALSASPDEDAIALANNLYEGHLTSAEITTGRLGRSLVHVCLIRSLLSHAIIPLEVAADTLSRGSPVDRHSTHEGTPTPHLDTAKRMIPLVSYILFNPVPAQAVRLTQTPFSSRF